MKIFFLLTQYEQIKNTRLESGHPCPLKGNRAADRRRPGEQERSPLLHSAKYTCLYFSANKKVLSGIVSRNCSFGVQKHENPRSNSAKYICLHLNCSSRSMTLNRLPACSCHAVPLAGHSPYWFNLEFCTGGVLILNTCQGWAA
jgi:hypothetical protein